MGRGAEVVGSKSPTNGRKAESFVTFVSRTDAYHANDTAGFVRPVRARVPARDAGTRDLGDLAVRFGVSDVALSSVVQRRDG
jgi:hypothetical protein